MRRILPSLLAAVALLALPAGAAAKARIALEPRCYQSGERGALTGSGFTPRATWTATLGEDRKLGSGRITREGEIDARFTAPEYHGTRGTRELELSVTDGRRIARTTFLMTPLTAGFAPRTGDPATLRVRWRVLGMGPRRGVYVHYVNPKGAHRRTLRIGTTQGPCGALKTGPIALFPFRYSYGRWTFQVDTSRRYDPETAPRVLLRFEIKRPAPSD